MANEKARVLRKTMTDAENRLWRNLRLKQVSGFKFRRQHPMGPYIVDFVCLEGRLIVEVDGSQHMQNEAYDQNRTAWLESQGFKILRFWNNQVIMDVEAVLEIIAGYLESPPPLPSPIEGEGREMKS